MILLAAGTVTSLRWTVHPVVLIDFDSVTYVRAAYALLDGAGYSYLGEPFTLRPPAFSVLLAPVLAAFGTDALAINVFVSLFGVLTVVLFYVYCRPRLGDVLAASVAIAIWINPQFQRLCHSAMSDIPGCALLLATLITERWARNRPHPGRDAIVGLVLAAAMYVRTVAVVLLPAILLSRFLSRSRARGELQRSVVVLAVSLAALLPWMLRNAAHRAEPPARQTFNYSQWTANWHTDRRDPSSPLISLEELLERSQNQTGWMISALGSRLRMSPLNVRIARDRPAVSILFGAFAIGLLAVTVWRRRESGEIFALGVLLMLVFWYATDDRFLLPVLFFALSAAALTLQRALHARLGRARSSGVVAVAVLALAAFDSRAHVDWNAKRLLYDRNKATAAEINERIPPDARIAGISRWWHDSFHLDRPVYSLYFARLRSGLPGVMEAMEHYDIDTVIHRGRKDELYSFLGERLRRDSVSTRVTLFHRDPRPGGAPVDGGQ